MMQIKPRLCIFIALLYFLFSFFACIQATYGGEQLADGTEEGQKLANLSSFCSRRFFR
jgi:hypothetical protein